jgi:hypothetical protein
MENKSNPHRLYSGYRKRHEISMLKGTHSQHSQVILLICNLMVEETLDQRWNFINVESSTDPKNSRKIFHLSISFLMLMLAVVFGIRG